VKPKHKKREELEYYRVDQEYRVGNRYLYRNFTSELGMPEENARRISLLLQRIGLGGRLVHLDGSPHGNVVDCWGGVDRVAEAKRRERSLDIRVKNI